MRYLLYLLKLPEGKKLIAKALESSTCTASSAYSSEDYQTFNESTLLILLATELNIALMHTNRHASIHVFDNLIV